MDLLFTTGLGQGMTVNLAEHLLAVYAGVERRSKPRIYELFPVTVHGVDGNGEAFEIDTALDNLSTGGLYMQLGQGVEPGATLATIVRFSRPPSNGEPALCVVLYGVVLRAELKPDGACGVAVKFTHHHFL